MSFVRILFTVMVTALVSGHSIAQVQFENITQSAGGPFHVGESWGASWGLMDDDVYPDLFVSNHGTLPSVLRNNGDGTFSERVKIADLEGIWSSEPLQDMHGGTWADFDNDGDQDLFATRSSQGARFHVFENNGNGFFEERGGPLGVGGNGGGRMPVLFDYTNDGRLDVALSRNGADGRIFKWGTRNFVAQTAATGLQGNCGGSSTGLVSDLFNTGAPNYLCMSEREIPYAAYDTTTLPFTDISDKFDRVGTNADAVLADFNNDLQIDLFALRGLVRPSGVKKISDTRIEAWMSAGGRTNFEKAITFSSTGPITVSVYARVVDDPQKIFIGASGYHPAGNPVTLDPTDPNNFGTFPNHAQLGVFIEYDDVAQEWTVALSGGGRGGEGAYFIIDGNNVSTPVITGLKGVDFPRQPQFLFNDGNRLVNAASRGINSIMCGSIAAADFDNDMDVDLYLTCRTSLENIPNRLYLNDGAGNFSLASGSTGAEGLLGAGVDGLAGTAESTVTADLDVDGFMDLFVTNGNRLFPHVVQDGFSGGGPDEIFRNLGGNGNHWLQIDLEGVTSNRDGFGARVIVTAGGVSQMREQNGQYHRWSHDHRRLHFGLAGNTVADVTIEWQDGSTDTFLGVAADKLYRATQGVALTDITPNKSAPTLSVSDLAVAEGSIAAPEVRLSAVSSVPVTVDYELINDTAEMGSDFSSASGTLTFAPGELTKELFVLTTDDGSPEPNETFVVSLFNAGETMIENSAAVVTIEDSASTICGEPDYSPGIEQGLFIWQDCSETGNWFVRTTAGGGSGISYETTFETDTLFGFLQEYSFEGKDFAVLSNANKRIESNMKMSGAGQDGIEFSVASGGELCLSLEDFNQVIYVGPSKAAFNSPLNLKTLNNTCAAVSLPAISIADATVSEGSSSVELTLTLDPPSPSPVSVMFATTDLTALSGLDYTAVLGTASFAANSPTQTISIPILQDNVTEAVENFQVTLSSPIGADLSDDVAIVSIEDNSLESCGEPSYNSSTDAGIFLWKDCGATNNWKVRATAGGGSAITYTGSLTAGSAMSALSPFSFEGIDSADLSNGAQQLDFLMKMAGGGVDGFEISVPSATSCFNVSAPASLPIIIGKDNTSLVPPFSLTTFGPC